MYRKKCANYFLTQELFRKAKIYELLPHSRRITTFGAVFCNKLSPFQKMCKKALELITGLDKESFDDVSCRSIIVISDEFRMLICFIPDSSSSDFFQSTSWSFSETNASLQLLHHIRQKFV